VATHTLSGFRLSSEWDWGTSVFLDSVPDFHRDRFATEWDYRTDLFLDYGFAAEWDYSIETPR